MYAKKSLGQHFLRDKRALLKIVGAAQLSAEDIVLEVGPGEGALTELLLERAGKVIAVEKDARLIPLLREKFAKEIDSRKLELISEDILDSRFEIQETRFKIVANLPYYITGQFLRKFLQTENQPSSMTLLLQKEVAKRIVAASDKESILSISVKCYGKPKIIGVVKAGSFHPKPKVDSAILVIENISRGVFKTSALTNLSPQPPSQREGGAGSIAPSPLGRVRGGVVSENAFFSLLKLGFSHPRKLLASNLGVAPEILEKCSIEKTARAENVTLEQWKLLSRA